jgi:hypothetical protein
MRGAQIISSVYPYKCILKSFGIIERIKIQEGMANSSMYENRYSKDTNMRRWRVKDAE